MHMVATRLGCQSTMIGTIDGPILALAAWTGLGNAALTLYGVISGREGCLGSEWVYDNQEC